MEWHRLSVQEVCDRFETTERGLSNGEAVLRCERFGTNELRRTEGRSPLLMLIGQFTDVLILILLASAVIAGLIGKPGDAAPIIVIVVLNALIGFVQELRAEQSMSALRTLAEGTATVMRDGTPQLLPVREIVPGDLVILAAGNMVPADMRLLEAVHLQTIEAPLTGESLPVSKQSGVLEDKELSLGDRSNMVYKGTVVATGRGSGLAVATGMSTELGRIASLLEETADSRTPLQRRLAVFGGRLAMIILAICGGIFFLGFLRGEPLVLMLLTAISLAVAAIPEALPAVVTITLALGARKMVRSNALIRSLPAVETLGAVTYICSDKTGTLTLNRMTVERIFLDGELRRPPTATDALQDDCCRFLTGLALCHDVQLHSDQAVIGDPTEAALLSMVQNAGFAPAEIGKRYPRLAELPFDSGRARMSTFHRENGKIVAYTKGSLESVLERSVSVYGDSDDERIDRDAIRAAGEEMARSGLRVLAVAMRKWHELPSSLDSESVECDLVFLGLAGMLDPPRDEALDAVAQCRRAGIVPVMITGDHPLTAGVIARRLGIAGENDRIVTGRELEGYSPEKLANDVEQIRVYARVAPEQKLNIIEALRERGQVVAMTGDGVNDAPALKKADIGVAMGRVGTDVAREASDLILLDDNFATIVKAVREGRRIYSNILKFITYSISCNTGTLVAIAFAPFLGLPLPLIPIQILWLNLLCDSLPGLALAGEPAERDIMERPPVDPGERIFSGARGYIVAGYGVMIGLATLLLEAAAIDQGLPWQTMIFTFLVLNRLAVAQAVRSARYSILRIGLFSNPALIGAMVITVLLQLAVIYLPFCRPIFATEPLSLTELSVTSIFAGGMLVATECAKGIAALSMRQRNQG